MGKMTGIYECPACYRPLTFRSAETRLIVCTCGSVLYRLESDDLVEKSILIIQDHNDLIMPGTRGVVQGRKFEVLGRFRAWFDKSVVNYWTLLVEGATLCWLVESYGMYAIFRRITLDRAITTTDLDKANTTTSLFLYKEDTYFLQRKDACWKYEVEGEVWMPECHDQFQLFDLIAKGDRHLQLMEFLPNYLVAYECKYQDFQSLQLTGLNQAPRKTMEVTCTQCKKSITVKTFPYAQSCSCLSCGARMVFKYSEGGFRASGQGKIDDSSMSLPLGATGTLKGISYEVIGYALKRENTTDPPSWKEYVLYNRAEGYAFLSEYEGSWLYAREKGDTPVEPSSFSDVLYDGGTKYVVFNRYQIRILDTAGEFPYNIYDDTSITSAEFIAAPRMWIYEKSREESINWFRAEHLERDTILEQFPYDLPQQVGFGILDPKAPRPLDPTNLAKITLLAIAVLIAVHFLIGAGKQNRILLQKEVQLADSASSTTFASSKFELTKWRSNLQFDIEAPVDNSWLEFEASLVNAGSGTEYALDQVVQYYHGYEDGENWTEGDKKETAWLTSIPSGTYFLRIQATRDTSGGIWNAMHTFTVTVKNDVSNDRNLWIFLGLLLIWPTIQFIRIYKSKK